MKVSREPHLPVWLGRILAASLLTILLLMPVHALLSTWGGTSIGPLWVWKSWKEILLVVVAILTAGWVVATPAVRRIVLRDRLAQLVAVFIGLSLIYAAVRVGELGIEATSAGLGAGLRYMTIAFVAFVLLRFGRVDWPQLVRKTMIVIVVGGVLLSILGLLQVTVLPRDLLTNFGYEKNVTIAPFMTIDENPDAPRAFATLRGPNEFGAFLILPLVASLLFIQRRSWKIAAAVIIGMGIFLSVSRSAWIGAMLALVALLILSYGNGFWRSKRFIYGSIVSLAIIAAVVTSAQFVPELRLAIFRSSPTDPTLTEGSTDQHLLSTLGGLSRIAENPFGCGLGCAGPASYYSKEPHISENYYVQVAEEVGVLGLVLWLAVAWTVMKRLYAEKKDILARALLASFVGFSAIGLLLHVWYDDPLSLTWWALAGAVLGYHASASRKKLVS